MSLNTTSSLVVASGIGLSVAALLYALRKRMTRKWIDLAAQHPELNDKARLDGQVVIVTGANTGLGRAAAEELAKRGPKVLILACRNVVAGNEAARAIAASTGHQNVRCMLLDLASLESVLSFVEELRASNCKVDTLVCNAGVWMPMEKNVKTADGFEVHVGVNHLGHFLLINKLLKDDLCQGPKRVVVVSSGLAASGKVNLDDDEVFYQGRLEETKGRKFAPTGYCDSKLMNVMFTKELVKRFPEVQCYAVCPGWCKSDLARNVKFPVYKIVLMLPFVFMFMRTAFQGAQNILYASLEDPGKLSNGGFYRDGQLQAEDSKVNESADANAKLWELSAKLVKLDE